LPAVIDYEDTPHPLDDSRGLLFVLVETARGIGLYRQQPGNQSSDAADALSF
jgi:hypothetical protein